jgi:hypothetical protein
MSAKWVINGLRVHVGARFVATSLRHVRLVPIGDINCRDCDVRSLAEPEPNRQVFVKFKHLLRKAAARSAETICVIIGEIL